jgi:hypothetical protein
MTVRDENGFQLLPAGLDVISQFFGFRAVPTQVNDDDAVSIGHQITVHVCLFSGVALDVYHLLAPI